LKPEVTIRWSGGAACSGGGPKIRSLSCPQHLGYDNGDMGRDQDRTCRGWGGWRENTSRKRGRAISIPSEGGQKLMGYPSSEDLGLELPRLKDEAVETRFVDDKQRLTSGKTNRDSIAVAFFVIF